MSVPNYVPFKQSDYPDTGLGDRDSLEKFYTQLNTTHQNIKQALNGQLDFTNLNGTSVAFTVTTPASDWIPAQLTGAVTGSTVTQAGSTSADANANGFSSLRYRYVPGGLVFDGACEYSAAGSGTIGTGTVAIPWTFVTGIPIPTGAPSIVGPAAGAFVDVGGNWGEINTNGVFHNITFANAALIRYIPSQGQLQLRSLGSGNPASPWGVPFLSVTCTFANPGLQPPPLNCFPFQVRIPDGKVVKDAWLTRVVDANQSNRPTTNVGVMDWAPVQSKPGFPNVFQVNNIPGLALGRTYQCRAIVLFQ